MHPADSSTPAPENRTSIAAISEQPSDKVQIHRLRYRRQTGAREIVDPQARVRFRKCAGRALGKIEATRRCSPEAKTGYHRVDERQIHVVQPALNIEAAPVIAR